MLQFVRCQLTKLVLFELSEYALYSIERELQALVQQKQLNVEIIPLIGGIAKHKIFLSAGKLLHG